ncbi:MAG TPA: ATP-binding protein, partial [Verrucomicrobiae bacterium]
MKEQGDNLAKERDQALLSWIQQHAPYGVFTLDTSLRVQTWNRWLESHSSFSCAQVKGRPVVEIFPELEKRKLVSPLQMALNGESSVLSTSLHHYLLPLKSTLTGDEHGRMRQTARIAPLISEGGICGVIVVIEDVTERESHSISLMRQHRRDEALSCALFYLLKTEEPRKSVRQLFFKIAELLDFDTFFLYLLDLESGTFRLSEAGGISDDLLKRFRESDLLSKSPDSRPYFLNRVNQSQDPACALLKEAKISSAVVIPLYINGKNLGSLCFGSWSREQIAPEESELLITVAQYLATALDRDNTNKELAEIFKREKAAREMAETAGRAKDHFLAALSHELRTPLNPVALIASDSAENEELSPDIRAQFRTILKNVEIEARLIDDLLDMTRINNGKLNLHLRTVDAHAVLRETLQIIDADVSVKDIQVLMKLNSEQHTLRADPVRLQQVFWNVLKNAVKFTPERGKIVVETFSTGVTDRLNVVITDSGIGMTPEELERLFSPFSQGDHHRINSSLYGGLGLGMAITKKLVEYHSGQIRASSNGRDQGSTFAIELPLAQNRPSKSP